MIILQLVRAKVHIAGLSGVLGSESGKHDIFIINSSQYTGTGC